MPFIMYKFKKQIFHGIGFAKWSSSYVLKQREKVSHKKNTNHSHAERAAFHKYVRHLSHTMAVPYIPHTLTVQDFTIIFYRPWQCSCPALWSPCLEHCRRSGDHVGIHTPGQCRHEQCFHQPLMALTTVSTNAKGGAYANLCIKGAANGDCTW